MAIQRNAWTFSPGKKPKSVLPGTLKDEVDTKARELIETVLKPKHVQPPPTGHQLNYITDITTKWLGSKCYLASIYACPGPNAVSPTFETNFARMEYVGNAKFALSFMRHTGQWVELYDALTVDECLKAIQDDPWFQPRRQSSHDSHCSCPDEPRVPSLPKEEKQWSFLP